MSNIIKTTISFDISKISLRIVDLLQTVLLKEETTEIWMRNVGLLRNITKCIICSSEMKISKGHDRRYFCSSCGKTLSIRYDTIFNKSHLSLKQLVQLLYYFWKKKRFIKKNSGGGGMFHRCSNSLVCSTKVSNNQKIVIKE
jgi:transposase-like protein